MSVNNPGSQHADSYTVFGASLGYTLLASHCDIRTFVSIDNLLDRRYAGSVIVNDSNGRYFEPAPGRTLLVGIELRPH